MHREHRDEIRKPAARSRRTKSTPLTLALAALLVGGVTCGPALPSVVDPAHLFTQPEQIGQKLAEAQQTKPEDLRKRSARKFEPIAFRPLEADRFDLISKWTLGPDSEERELFSKHGFVISRSHPFQSFPRGYLRIFEADLPVYVTADAILHAWHRAYDGMLMQLEEQMLIPTLDSMLTALRERLDRSGRSPEVRGDLDTLLSVARSLLDGEWKGTLGPEVAADAKRFYDACLEAGGIERVQMFGSARSIDFSQCKPRGHYTKTEALQRYFRAMIWLGRTDFRLIESQVNGARVFVRRQVEDVAALRGLFGSDLFAQWDAMDRAITVFVGMHDSMTLRDLDGFLREVGASGFSISGVSDDRLRQAVEKGGYGRQLILSDPVWKRPEDPTFQTNASFAVFGQRYTVDSHVLHSVTEDRVRGRQLPVPLDVAFGALANDHAVAWIGQDLDGYAGELAGARALIDAQTEPYWKSSLYTIWLWALRGLSPAAASLQDLSPTVLRSEPWARRVLNTQLGSWSELRHDTILYAKQSYSVGILCEFPDAYVDPYPEFYRRLRETAVLGRQALGDLEGLAVGPAQKAAIQSARAYFNKVDPILQQLEAIARDEVHGRPLSKAHLEFVNRMIRSHSTPAEGCGGGSTTYDGWYVDLLHGADLDDPDFTIADVHTSMQAGILHVAKGLPRRFIVAIDSPQGPRAFVGAVFSFHNLVRQSRLNDQEWRAAAPTAEDPAWMRDIVAHSSGSR